MVNLLITHLLLSRKFAVLNKALIGIVSAIVFLMVQAIISSINTKASYEFSVKNTIELKETLKITLNDGHASMLFSQNGLNAHPSSFDGFFLRFQNHYFLLGIEHIGKNNSQLMFNSFFIDSLRTGNAIYISGATSFCEDNNAPNVLLGKIIVN